jgi:hypothetical protein
MIVSFRRIALPTMVALCNIRCHSNRTGVAGRVDDDERMNIQDRAGEIVAGSPGFDRSVAIAGRAAHQPERRRRTAGAGRE